MKELKIDERNITGLIRKVLELMKDMTEEIDLLENKDADIFERYMALHRLGAMWMGANHAMHMANHAFRFGFDLQHPFFQTKEAIDSGWDEVKLERNPFFVQEEPKGIEIQVGDLPESMKKAIWEIIKQKFEKKESDCVH